MKKKILLFTFVSLLFLTACNNQNTDIEKKSDTAENVSSDTAENVSVDFLSDYENCRNKNYVNLDFSNCSARLPELNTCSSLNVTVANSSGVPHNENLENFKKYCEFFSASTILQMRSFHHFRKILCIIKMKMTVNMHGIQRLIITLSKYKTVI